MQPSSFELDACPPVVADYASQTVEYVRRALGLTLEYDSDTLPLLDHYLRAVPSEATAALELVCATAGAYFGEVVRRRLGGAWEIDHREPAAWRLVLPSGAWFPPAQMVAAAISREELAEARLAAVPRLAELIERILDGMAPVSEESYFSLCGRLDTLEHVQAVLLETARAAQGEPS